MIKLEKIIKYGIYLAMVLPLVFTSRTMYPWHFGKTILFQILVEILLVLALIYFSINKEKKLVRLNLLDWLVLAFVAIQLICSIFGVNFSRSFWGNQQRAQGVFTWLHFTVFYFILRQFFITKKDWLRLIIWILLVAFISSILAWLGRYFPILENIIADGVRLSGMIGNPIFFASYLIIPVFLGLALFLGILTTNEFRAGKWQWLALLAGIACFITLIFTQIRGAFLGLAAGIFIIWLIYILFSRYRRARKIAIAVGLLVIILTISAYFFNQQSSYFRANFPVISHLLDITPKTTTASTRLMAWQIVFKSWLDKPFFGWGPENFQDAFDKHYNPEFLKYSFAETVWDKPHSYPLEVLNAMGLAGFICYLAIVITLFFYLVRLIKKQDNENKRLAFIILAGAVAAYVAQSSFAFETSNSLLLWIATIAIISFFFGAREPGEITVERQKKYTKAIAWVTILIIVATPYFLYKNISFYRASVKLGDARDAADIGSKYLWQKKAPQALEVKVPFLWEQAVFLTRDLANLEKNRLLDKATLESVAPLIIKIFEEEIERNQHSYLYRFWLSQVYGYMGEYINSSYYERSNQLLDEAWRLSPQRQHIPLLLAKNYLLQNKTEEGIRILEELVKKNPEFLEPHWFLGLALVKNNQEDRGVAELEKSLRFGMGFKSNILYLIDLYAKRQEYKKIIPLYKKLLEDDANNAASYYANLAATYAALGDEENTVISLDKAVKLNPALAEEAKLFLEQQGIDIGEYR